MCVQRLKRALYGAGVIVLLGACNQIDTVLPSAEIYQVDALTGQLSLNECSVIAAGDEILPYFVNSVVNDPDLNSLVLYVEDADRKVLGRRVSYTTEPGLPLPRQAGTEQGEAGLGEAEEAAVYEVPGDLTIRVRNFSEKLPSFPLPEGLGIGSYSLVFEIRGRQDLLSRVNRPFYYIGDRKFTTGDIRCYLPGFYGNSHLVPQGLTVMLETELSYEQGLEPYIIWYNGKSRIGEGSAAAGVARLLWTPPPRQGFHTIRAELFPFEPRAGQKGRIREFSLPVSQKIEAEGAIAGEYLYRYQLAGDLLDTRTGMGLEPLNPDGSPPSWYPADQVYGLALGAGEVYEALRCSLDFSERGGEELNFFIRFLSLKEGRIFAAGLGSLDIGLFAENGALVLNLEGKGQKSRISGVLPEPGRGPAFTGVLVKIRFEGAGARVSLALADSLADGLRNASAFPGAENGLSAEIGFDLSAGGELRSWIGAEQEKEWENRPPEETAVSGSLAESPGRSPASFLPVLVVDDFAAAFGVSRGEGAGPGMPGQNPDGAGDPETGNGLALGFPGALLSGALVNLIK
jgi:hypothetical protein